MLDICQMDGEFMLSFALSVMCTSCRQVSTTGALGKRTVHQVDPKAQLVVQVTPQVTQVTPGVTPGADTSASNSSSSSSRPSTEELLSYARSLDVPKQGLGLDEAAATQELQGLQDESCVYATPMLLEGEGVAGGGRVGGLSGLEQALLLCLADHVRKGSSKDELQQWQMAPYVEAVLQQEQSQYMIQVREGGGGKRREGERGGKGGRR